MAGLRADNGDIQQRINVEQDARVIASLADDTAARILAKRHDLDAAGQKNQPLFVALGEDHAMPAHQIFELAVLHSLKNAGGRCLMGFEREHNLLMREYSEGSGYELSPAAASELRQQDRNGALSLKANIAFYRSETADHMSVTLLSYCLATNTPSMFSDAASYDDFLDNNDPSTRASIASCLGEQACQTSINSKSPAGVQVRNHHMLTTMLAAHNADAGVILQQTGVPHVVGRKSGGRRYRYHHSLLGLCGEHTPAVGCLPSNQRLSSDNIDTITITDCPAAQELYLYHNLPEWQATYDPFEDTPLDNHSHLQCRAAESAYTSGVLNAMGLGAYAIGEDEYWEYKRKTQDDLQDKFAAIDKAARTREAQISQGRPTTP